MSEWAHLPNALHIDRIFIDVPRRPGVWRRAYDATSLRYGQDAREKVWNAAWNRSDDSDDFAWMWVGPWNEIRRRALHAESDRTTRAHYSASDPILALCRWEEAGSMMSLQPAALRLLIASDNNAALLMYSASLAFSTDGHDPD